MNFDLTWQHILIVIIPFLFFIGLYLYNKKLDRKLDVKEDEIKESHIPHYFCIETEADKDNALAKLRILEFKKGKFAIRDVKVSRYLDGVLLGDPKEAINGEYVRPISMLPLAEDNLLEYGYQYIVPETFEGELKSFGEQKIKRLPEWLYSLSLISDDFEHELYLYFRSHTVLDVEELQQYVDNHANISLARKYRI